MEQDEWVSTEPQIWKEEEKGDTIEGKLVGKREKGGKYGNASYLIENDEGVRVVFGTTVLENRMPFTAPTQSRSSMFMTRLS